MHERGRYSKAMFNKKYEDLTEEQQESVNDIAFENTRNVLPNYSRVPKLIRFLRVSPLLGNFVSFQAESIRTMVNTWIITKKEMNSDNPAIRSIGMKRIAGMVSYGVAKTAFLGALGSAAGVGFGGLFGMLFDDDEEIVKKQALRDFVAPWSKKSDIVLVEESPGVYTYYDFSSSDPHGYARTLLNTLAETDLEEDGITVAVAEMIIQMIQPFTEMEITTRGGGGLIFNKDAYGKDIINPETGKIDQAAAILEYIFDVVKPGNIAVIERIIAAESSDQRYDEIQTAFTGARPYRLDVNKSFGYKIYAYKKRLSNAEKLKYDNYDKSVESKSNVLQDFHQTYKNAITLGVDPLSLQKQLKNSRLSKKEIYAIKTGIILDNIVKKPKE
jgi:hypothetical protein